MSYLQLPKRVYRSPLLKFANFKDGSHVNLIRIEPPYANGDMYAVSETTSNPFCSNGMFKDLNDALNKFNLMVRNHSRNNVVVDKGITRNVQQSENL